MKVLFLTNNLDVTRPLLDWLKETEGADNVALSSEGVCSGHFARVGQFAEIEFVVSYNYLPIVRQDIIDLFPHRIINLHISLLPWNRGMSPNIWSFLEGTPAGVTIHEIDAGVDTGDVLLQKEIVFDYERETLRSSYEKSHALISQLFRDNWDRLKSGMITPTPQGHGGTLHRRKDSRTFNHLIDYEDTIAEFVRKVGDGV
ncbi:MAG: formyl transferase [Lachnospiraceae bacterium]|jgi:methionyl-tRNA formyltransferase|nr:formyl transferase [Lachnospiraceae bacterium]